MNKTVNINLAGTFFYIDEDAYLKLQRYLEAIKRSFTDAQGRSEIIADIEARIAELFTERMKHDKQVISSKEVDDVINIMGQPEDYLVDEEIFEDDPKSTYTKRSSKKLYRDTDNSYIGGVSSGLGHYLGIDAVWVRLLWILLALGSGGTFILIYILFWILVPEAVTTAEKLTMTGEPVNITNIEKKIRDGIDNVSETVKNVDYEKYGNKVKSNSKSFFDTLGDIIMFCLKVFAKFIGVLLILIGASTLIGLIIGLFTFGISDFANIPGFDFIDAANAANTPVWLSSLLTFFFFGIPFFFLFYLGLKILVNNLKSIGNIAKFSLLGLWILSIVGLIIIGIRQASEHAFDANATKTETLQVTAQDTLYLKMQGNTLYSNSVYRNHTPYKLVYNEADEKLIYSSDVRLIVKSTKDSLASIRIEKTAEGNSYKAARERANDIDYSYLLSGNELQLNAYHTTAFKSKFRDQEVEVTLYLPEGLTLYADDNTYSFHRNSSYYNDILHNDMEEHYLKVMDDELQCLDCDDEDFEVNIDIKKKDKGVIINGDSLEIKGDKSLIKINDEGINAKSESVNVKIDDNGVNISSKKD
ncbi:PspC domain-containing protein [Mangrovimonas spongiae]|uniref:PspC domain-containing protein n=1 Tax=Mangrovimonas spongiae TaxID=2494697 RepID=A0A3R9MCZ1_9FLAO|nr:PspC domain-containing protein [Mangrovimonas spongiae]RSK39121.1 PspC domain-containing protein [Mangrovimonas spongiae]